ncbi:tetratricopeptide repeat protein [Polaromonas sp.]|uniref:tetratricopeptide repeat protein n=1 Tax=Polaromonas sp. TaxID=1869339 RepID=UPI0013B955CA|nr:tetratricopeptide repeat protein [Polaromonas sp.]NDP63513.1 tetratricopeptide repeat protein [Polaromonas sp.]
MGKAGGIIGIISGVFGFIAAIFTLLIGGVGSAFKAQAAGTIVGLGWGGVFFSFLAIVFGAVAFARPKLAGIGLICTSIMGAILGGTMVAVCMALAFLGGILAILGAPKGVLTSSGTDTKNGPIESSAITIKTLSIESSMEQSTACAQCGEQVLRDTQFCRHCGTQLFDTTSPKVVSADAPIGNAVGSISLFNEKSAAFTKSTIDKPANRARSKAGSGQWKFFVLSVVAVAALGATGYVTWQYKNASDALKAQQEAEREQQTKLALKKAVEEASALAAKNTEEKIRTEIREKQAAAVVEQALIIEQSANVTTTVVAPITTPSLLEKAKVCSSAQDCVEVMLSAVEPLQQEIVHLAAARISDMPKPIAGDRKAARSINQRGIELLSSGANEEALQKFSQARDLDARDVEIQANLGWAYVLTNKPSEAKQALISALLLDPRRTSAWSPLADAHDLEGNSKSAVAALLLAYEFSSNRDKTVDFFKLKADTAARPTMRSTYVSTLHVLEQRLLKAAKQ